MFTWGIEKVRRERIMFVSVIYEVKILEKNVLMQQWMRRRDRKFSREYWGKEKRRRKKKEGRKGKGQN